MLAFGLAAAPALSARAAEPEPVAAAAPEPLPEALALAREAVKNGFPPEQRSAMFRNVMDASLAQMRAVYLQKFNDAGVQQIIDHYLDGVKTEGMAALDTRTPALFEAFARAYAREFSLAELRQIRDFTATPAGRHFTSRGSVLLSDPDVQTANIAFMTAVRDIAQAHQPALVSELQAYFTKHPDVARKAAQQASPAP